MDSPRNDISEWLRALGFSEYAQAFAAQKIGPDVLSDLTDTDLEKLGIAALGDRKRLLRAIAALSRVALESTADGSSPQPSANREIAVRTTHERDAERRQLTVMFCDLVGSTALSRKLDPEEYQQVLRDYHQTVDSAVAPFSGHVAQYLGDGVLVYFGYPQAHEDDAERAIRAAMGVLSAVNLLRGRGDVQPETRIGIATGLVVVGPIGSDNSIEKSASGETPNLAARLQALAQVGEIVISDETRRLARAAFGLESVAGVSLKGFPDEVKAWRVRGERGVPSRFDARRETASTAILGRESEVALLVGRWRLCRHGEGQVVLMTGEAGIGKSRICQALRESIADDDHGTVLLQCSPYFSGSALYPVFRRLERTAGIAPTDPDQLRAEKIKALADRLAPSSAGPLMRALGLSTPDNAQTQDPQRERAQILNALIDLLLGITAQRQLLLLVEDAHWIDPTTDELIGFLVERLRNRPTLTLITARPEYAPSWSNPVPVMRLQLSRLVDRITSALVRSTLDDTSFPPEVVDEIVRRSDGVPLFAEELAMAVLQSRAAGPALSKLTIPTSLQDSLTARLDRLGSAKEVAQAAAVIGREFTHRRLAGAMPTTGPELAHDIDQLVRAGIVFRRGMAPEADYTFKHALTRDAAYNSLLNSRRAQLHARVAAMIEAQEPDTVATQPELLAYHYQMTGDPAKAFSYWTAAGDLAASRSAAVEAAKHYRSAIDLVPALAPEDEAKLAKLEFGLQMRLGGVLSQSEGYTSQAGLQCFESARRLASTLGEPDKYARACAGTCGFLLSAGRLSAATEVFEDILLKNPSNLSAASRLSLASELGHAKILLGEFGEAWKLLGGAYAELDRNALDRLRTPGATFRATLIATLGARVRMHQGHFGEARAMFGSGLEFARHIGQAQPLAVVLSAATHLAYQLGAGDESRRYAEELCELCERQGLQVYLGIGRFQLGLLRLESGNAHEALGMMQQGLEFWGASAGKMHSTEFVASAADALLLAGQIQAADDYVTRGEAMLRNGEERLLEAELRRLRGRLQMIDGDARAAEEHFRVALELAERQGARRYSLRAGSDLAELLTARGRLTDAREVIGPIYRWFPEDLSNPDLFRANEVLKNLAA